MGGGCTAGRERSAPPKAASFFSYMVKFSDPWDPPPPLAQLIWERGAAGGPSLLSSWQLWVLSLCLLRNGSFSLFFNAGGCSSPFWEVSQVVWKTL